MFSVASVRGARPMVMVIEDEPVIRDTLALALAGEGYAVLTAANGRDALKLLQASPVDVILLDLMMPVMDGRTFRVEQLLHPNLKHIPVIVLTAAYIVATDLQSLRPSAYHSKPFDLDVVLHSVALACTPAY